MLCEVANKIEYTIGIYKMGGNTSKEFITYSYLYADFTKISSLNIDLFDLQNQINNLSLVSAKIQHISEYDDLINIYFNKLLTYKESEILTNLIINYIPYFIEQPITLLSNV